MKDVNKPEIRFAGYTDAWEKRMFSELYAKNTEKNNGHFDVSKTISIANMYFNNGGNGAADKSLDAYKVLRVGDIAFEGNKSKNFSYGRMVMNDIGDGIMSPRFTTLRPKNKQVISFWKILIHYEPIMKRVLVQSTKKGTMMNELVVSDFLNQTILTPSLEEQAKIGEFFKKLDELIIVNQRKLDLLNELKKVFYRKCLSNMI